MRSARRPPMRVGGSVAPHRRRQRPGGCKTGSGRSRWIRRSRDRHARSRALSRPRRRGGGALAVRGCAPRFTAAGRCDNATGDAGSRPAAAEPLRSSTTVLLDSHHPNLPKHRQRGIAAGVWGNGLRTAKRHAVELSQSIPSVASPETRSTQPSFSQTCASPRDRSAGLERPPASEWRNGHRGRTALSRMPGRCAAACRR